MIDNFISSFSQLIASIEKQNKYITTKLMKDKIEDFYKRDWLPISQDFKDKFGESSYNLVENKLFEIYRHTKANVLVKKKLIDALKIIEPILDNIQIETIRKYGTIIEYDKKKQILQDLTKYNFNGTIGYLKNSEKDFKSGDWKNTCSNSRLALEEFTRELREKVTRRSVPRGTLSNHITPIKVKTGLKDAEIKLIKEGFYGFLSEKGSHATIDIPDREDGVISIYLVYIVSDYILKKYSQYI